MVDLFYGGAAHSSSYPPTHCIMPSVPFFSRVIIASSSWDATGNYFQLPLPAVAQGSSDMKFSISYTKLTSLRLLQQIQMSKFNESIIHHSLQIVKELLMRLTGCPAWMCARSKGIKNPCAELIHHGTPMMKIMDRPRIAEKLRMVLALPQRETLFRPLAH